MGEFRSSGEGLKNEALQLNWEFEVLLGAFVFRDRNDSRGKGCTECRFKSLILIMIVTHPLEKRYKMKQLTS